MNSAHVSDSAAVLLTDSNSTIIRINPAFTALTGFTADDVVGQSSEKIYLLAENEPSHSSVELEALKHHGIWSGAISLKHANGEIIVGVQTTVSIENAQGEISHFIHIIQPPEVTAKEYHQKTQMPNRQLFKEVLSQELKNAQRKKTKLGVLLIDVDHFKVINNFLGFEKGDELLQMISERLNEQLRGNDLLASLGSNQFAVLLPELAHPEDASTVTRKLMQTLESPFHVGGQDVVVTLSTGIVIFPGDGEDSESLLQHAEKSMYNVKAEGRNGYQFFEASIQNSALNRLSMESEMRKAIEREEFVLFYQPQIDIESGLVVGMESLIRWMHPEKGMVPPFHFIPIAEETGLIGPIGEWVIYEACRQTKAWQEAGVGGLKIAVNLSGRQFTDRQLLEKIAKTLEQTGLKPGDLELEITESTIMNDIESTIKVLEKLSEMGMALAIDDFGTGYSSLSYLKRFPINKLKIDKSFIDDVITSEDDATIVAAIIGLSHNLKLNVICEGVEDVDQLNWLKENKCNEIQGYYFSKPLPADEFEAFVRERNSL